jgi:ankyrin repeat protein
MDRKEKSAKNKNRFSFLLSSIRKESIEEVKEILEKWTNLLNLKDKNGRSALHYCTEHSSALCADMILKKSPQLLTAQDNEGYTALHLSVIVGNQTMTRFLISISDINYLDCCDNEMHTAIHWATVCAELECLDLLMNAGANPSTADIHGAFPIHYAAQMCSPHSGICIGNDSKIGLSVLNRLLQSPNVDVNCVDSDGRSPLLWAASVGELL